MKKARIAMSGTPANNTIRQNLFRLGLTFWLFADAERAEIGLQNRRQRLALKSNLCHEIPP
jgi:hypothetical protein